MGTFVTADETLFSDKSAAPGAELPAGWSTSNVPTADNLNDLRDACYDLRTYVKGVVAPTLTALGAMSAHWDAATGNDAPRFWVSAGSVHLMGSATANDNAAASTLFPAGTIPADYRPSSSRMGSCNYYDSGPETETFVTLSIQPDGSVVANIIDPGADDQVSFYACWPIEAP